MISTTGFDRLIQLGRRRGGLEIDDIRQALPVDTMTIEELADVVARLEEAGISVEIDPALLTPRHRKSTLHEAKPTTEPSRPSEQPTTAHVRPSRLASSGNGARANSSRTRGPGRTDVKMSGTIFVIVAALILLIFAFSVWRFI